MKKFFIEKKKLVLVIFFFTLLLIISILRKNDDSLENKSTLKNNPTLIYSGEEIYSTWKSPNSEELFNISKALAKSNIRGCGEYYIIEIRNKEYIVACTSDGDVFNYITVWAWIEKAGELPYDEVQVKIKPTLH